MPPLDPATLGAIIQAGSAKQKQMLGIGQVLFSGQRKAEKALTKQIEAIPEYLKSPSILEYYEQARQRYGVSPTQTAMYKQQMQDIERSGAGAVSQLRGSRERLGGTSTILNSLLRAKLGANVAAEQEQNRRFGQLGAAAQMMRGEDVMKQQRDLMKQEQRIRQAAAKAAGRAAIQRAGFTNITGSLTDMAKAGASMSGGMSGGASTGA